MRSEGSTPITFGRRQYSARVGDLTITETRHCGEKLNNMFSDSEWDKHCAENPNYSVEDTMEGKPYKCFEGALAYLQAANCNAKTLLAFDPAKQHFDFFFSSVRGHPEDPLGVFK